MTVSAAKEDVSHTEAADRPPRRSSRRLAMIFLAASVSLHAAVLVMWPGWMTGGDSPGVSTLEVVILQLEPLPVSVVPPVPTPPRQQAESKNKHAQVQLKAEREQSAPVVALLKPGSVPEYPFTVAPSRLSEPPPPAFDPKSQMAGAAVVPPIISSALLSNPAPRYPLASRRSGEQGTVTLRVLVTREGSPARVDVEKSSGSPPLDAAALQAVKAWRFTPARQGQNAIESWMLVPVVFRLEGSS